MSNIGQPERATQNRVIALFRDEFGYRYLSDWRDHDGASTDHELGQQKNVRQKNEDQPRFNRHFSAGHFSAV